MAFRDSFGRKHDDLRISVTDRCNLRCAYCMPAEPVWFDREELLTYEEIARLVRIAVRHGVRKLRVTGGEPLVRKDLAVLIRMLAQTPGVEELSLTTNGLLLPVLARKLARAGLQRINVSLDTLVPERYERVTRRSAFHQVMRGLETAAAAGLTPIKINTVLLRGYNEDEVEALVGRARENAWQVRFIEFMPLENDGSWDRSRIVPGAEVRRRIEKRWPLERSPRGEAGAPAVRYDFRDGRGAVGFINSVTEPFCSTCSRLRLTSDGKFRVCLYDPGEADLREPLRRGADDAFLEQLMERAVLGKGRGGALEILERRQALPLDRTMHQIGG